MISAATAEAVARRSYGKLVALLSARTALLRVQTDRLAQRANLYLALGGGFGDAAGSPLASR